MKKLGCFASLVTLCIVSLAQADLAGGAAGLEAQYTFPTTPEQQQYATFALNNFSVARSGNQVSVSYTLPRELVGSPNVAVNLSGTASDTQPFQVSGEQGSATCTNQSEHFTCNVTYTNLNTNLAKTNQFLRNNFSDPSELQIRMNIAASFASNPQGVVSYYVQ
jgi:hypothetical protein